LRNAESGETNWAAYLRCGVGFSARQALSSSGARWWLFGPAAQAPRQIASHHVGDHSKQHQEHSDPKNPTVVHSLPARTMIMAAVVLVIMLYLIHSFLVSWLDQYLAE